MCGGLNLRSATARHTAVVPARVHRGDAQRLSFEDASFDAVIVDPPYYDAIQYGDLSDFFYVWLKRSVGPLYPTFSLLRSLRRSKRSSRAGRTRNRLNMSRTTSSKDAFRRA